MPKTKSKKSGFLSKLSSTKKKILIVVAAVVVLGCGYLGYSYYQNMNADAASLSGCPTLRSGSRGSCVTALQQALNAKSCAGLSVDGSFGPNTKTAVINYQRSKGLSADGIVGSGTRNSLNSAANASCSGASSGNSSGGHGATGTSTSSTPNTVVGWTKLARQTVQAVLKDQRTHTLKADLSVCRVKINETSSRVRA